MTGGVTSAVHRLTVERGGGTRTFVVLRQYEHALPHVADLVEREAAILGGIDPAGLTAPDSATRPDVWRDAIAVLRSPPPRPRPPCFIHRDFQHFNLLWAGRRLTGVVDWSVASSGPPEVDVGHCRLNLAVLFSPDWAERFRLAYEAETGHGTDPWWDLHALAAYRDSWRRFIPIQVGGRVPVDAGGMTARVEDLIESVLGRL
jgi:aminoglycoside/choline kinase family phosphotransferase